MKRFAIIIFLILPAWSGASVEADSLAVEGRLVGLAPAERIELLQEQVRLNLRNDPRLAIALARRSLAEAAVQDDPIPRNQALMDIGVAHYFMGDYRNALRRYEEALVIAEEIGDKVRIGNALNNIGVLYFVWGEHDRALDSYLRALSLRLETDDLSGAASCYNNIAGVHHTAGRYEDALDYYHRALAIYRDLDNQIYEASTLNNIGLVLFDQGQFDAAMVEFEAALALEREGSDLSGQALSLNNMGMARAKQDRPAEAMDLFREALALRRDIDDRQGESVTLQQLGSILVETGNQDGGIRYLEDALAIARELEVQELIRDDLLALSEAWEKAGRPDRALAYHRLFKEAHDRIFDEERARQMAAAEASFEVDLKDREIAGLRREAEFEAFRRRIMLIGAGLSVIIIALLWNRYRMQKRAHLEIRAKNVALGQAHAELQRATREELAHVGRVATMGELTAAFAHELHQPLTAIKANARAARNLLAQPARDRAEVDEALEDIRDDAERAREIIRRLREMMRKGEERREEHDLNQVVRAAVGFIEGAAQRQGVPIRLELEPDLPPLRCDNIQLQQVVINLVQNGLKAMEPDGGVITITTNSGENDEVGVRVRDAGPAVTPDVLADMFDPFFTTKDGGLGMGLPICKSIIEAHEGNLQATRHEGGGLTLEFCLPAGGRSTAG